MIFRIEYSSSWISSGNCRATARLWLMGRKAVVYGLACSDEMCQGSTVSVGLQPAIICADVCRSC